MSERELLESLARSDRLMDHPDCMTEEGTCGCCMTLWCMAEAARRLLKKESGTSTAEWDKEYKKLWHNSKYYKLYQEEQEAGRDPHKAFEERGWEM